MRETVSGGITEGTGERMEEEKEGVGFPPDLRSSPTLQPWLCLCRDTHGVTARLSHSSDGDDGDDDDDDDTKQLQ